jgi:hypothetical protein
MISVRLPGTETGIGFFRPRPEGRYAVGVTNTRRRAPPNASLVVGIPEQCLTPACYAFGPRRHRQCGRIVEPPICLRMSVTGIACRFACRNFFRPRGRPVTFENERPQPQACGAQSHPGALHSAPDDKNISGIHKISLAVRTRVGCCSPARRDSGPPEEDSTICRMRYVDFSVVRVKMMISAIRPTLPI